MKTTTHADIGTVRSRLAGIADFNAHPDKDRLCVGSFAPDAADYGGATEPGSEWDEECDRLLVDVESIVRPLGWMAQWVDDDMVVEPVDA
jgi:hypothetical protein